MRDAQPKPLRTLDARTDHASMIKPGEMIDVVEMSPLTLTDRRIYNALIENAWNKIDRAVTHVIAKTELRGSHESNDRIGDSVERLMAAIARLEIERDDKRYTRRVQLLGATDEGREDDALLYYRFPSELRAIIRKTSRPLFESLSASPSSKSSARNPRSALRVFRCVADDDGRSARVLGHVYIVLSK